MSSMNKPLLLKPAAKDYLWGGSRLKDDFGKAISLSPLAETWECSTHPDGQSLVAETGEPLGELLNRHVDYLGSHPLYLTGGKAELPILIKLIDAKQDLSVQVHPDDEYALKNEGEFGKTEMWYVLDAVPDAKLIYGLNRKVTKKELQEYINSDRITELCNFVPVKKGDVFFIPAGTVHAIGEGMLIAEVQQNSNITYRVSDYGRLGADGKPRALHKEKALDVISREPTPLKRDIKETVTASTKEKQLADCKYFNVKVIDLSGQIELCQKDSFVSLLMLEGEAVLEYTDGCINLKKADSVFIPAGIDIIVKGKAKILVSRV